MSNEVCNAALSTGRQRSRYRTKLDGRGRWMTGVDARDMGEHLLSFLDAPLAEEPTWTLRNISETF